jgi:hypothetical protein
VTFQASRRAVLAAGLTLALPRQASVRAAQLGRIDDYDPLAWLPALPEDPELYPSTIATHADMITYWEARGINRPQSFDGATAQDWMEIGQYLPVNDGVMLQYLAQDWDDMVGFSLWDADQVTVANDPPDQIRLYHGSFDPEQISNRLGAAGYESERDGDFMLVTNPSEGHDLSTELGRFTLGNFNHIAASETLVIAVRFAEAREQALNAGLGDVPSLADQAAFDTLLAEMTGYLVLNGSVLSAQGLGIDTTAATLPDPVLPPASMLIGGIDVDKDTESVVFLVDVGDPDLAEKAIPGVAAVIETGASVRTNEPYLNYIGDYGLDVEPRTGMLRLVLTGPEFTRRWQQFIYARDLLFLGTP